ncbi:MAG: GntR family transcriptional regulator [Aquisalimonadaceae bacterium]
MKSVSFSDPSANSGRASDESEPVALERLRAAVDDADHLDEPRHSRLRAAILDALAAGYWAPGDKLPPETEIARAVGLSLGTVRKALARLAREQVLMRRHGRGTFVSGGGAQSNQLMHFRFVGDDGSTILPVYAEVLDRRVIQEQGPWSSFLGGSSGFIRVRRMINVADEFNCLSEFYIDAHRFSQLLDMPLADLHRVVIRNLLARHFNAPTFTLTQFVHAAEFPEHVRTSLKLSKKRGFGIVLEAYSYTHHKEPISFQNIFIPAGVRRLETSSSSLVK